MQVPTLSITLRNSGILSSKAKQSVECWVGSSVLSSQGHPHHSVIQSGASGTLLNVTHLSIKARCLDQQEESGEHSS